MLRNEYALTCLFNSVQQIIGRKRLQKTVYLLQQIGFPYAGKFTYHHYGPYSSELQAEIDRLVDYRLLSETYNNKAYIYKITEDGITFIKEYEEFFGIACNLPQEIVQQLTEASVSVLEMASTYVYLLEIGYKKEEASRKAQELKPHLKDCLDEAITLFENLQQTTN